MKKIVAINAGPRKGWNTDNLIRAVEKGAADQGAEICHIDLYDLDNVKGCVSCFACMTEASFGKCAYKDDLAPVLQKIRESDGLIIGSPNYFSNMTAGFRAVVERLAFQNLTYAVEKITANPPTLPVVLIMTSNNPEENYEKTGYDALLKEYKGLFTSFVGPTEVLACGNTLQVNDYSKYNWTMFDPKEKQRIHNEEFPKYLERAYEMGKNMVQKQREK